VRLALRRRAGVDYCRSVPVDWSELQPRFQAISQRMEIIEKQVALISERLGMPFEPMSSGVPVDVISLANEGKTLEAIKLYRQLTGASLDEARGIVASL
jgi:ribosomal protein L7/L12